MATYRFRPLGSVADIEPLRKARLAALMAPPELFVELAVQDSSVHAVEADERVGYLTARAGTLTEFFVVAEHRTHADAILEAAVADVGLRHAWASTFDPVALAACTSRPRTYQVVGYSFRQLEVASIPKPEPLPNERQATPDDVDRVEQANHPDVFSDRDEIATWIDNRWVTLFESGQDLAGFGLCTPTGPLTPGCDIGVCVASRYRRKGLGAWIVQRMAAHAARQDLVPTAGCAADNLASRRTLERAGFVADHRLLQFAL